MRILFVAQAVSIHTARWINQLNDQGWDLHLFDMRGSFPHAELRGITEYSLLFPRRISTSVPVSYGNPIFLKYGLDPFPLSLVGFFTRRLFRNRMRQLASLIKKIQPDIIHSMEMQAESYPLLSVREMLAGEFPAPWIVTTWGSDIFHYKQFPDHLEMIKKILACCDYLIPDCQRDVVLARELGFKGSVPMVLPGAGGYSISNMRSLIAEQTVSKRRLIMVKGYHGWAGLGLNALEALDMSADILTGYEVVVYLASPIVVEKVKSLQKSGKLNIRVLPRSPHQTVLELFAKARVAIAINHTDGIPNAMLEAMTMGAFPIQSNTESTSEWITNNVNGLLVDPHNISEIREAVNRAVLDDNFVDNAAKNNLDLVFNRLDISNVKPQVIEMYESIVKNRKGSRSE